MVGRVVLVHEIGVRLPVRQLVMLTIKNDGDALEQKYWYEFISTEFPQYENFWVKSITPLTNRPQNVHFKSDTELAKISKTSNDICIAQLHYTLLTHLVVAYNLLQYKSPLVYEEFEYGIVKLSAATDVADELLERFINPTTYDPWNENEGRRARKNWRKNHQKLQWLRNYRNRLLHGRVLPKIVINGSYDRLRVPRFDKVDQYIDWRNLTNGSIGKGGSIRENDFDAPKNLLQHAWVEVLKYLRTDWQNELL